MKRSLLRFLLIPAFFALVSFVKPVDKHHFVIYGNVIELEPENMFENDVAGIQVVVYQDNEIYVAFDTNEKGDYEFNLPNNHYYEIHYGTRNYIPKVIEIDANQVVEKRDGYEVKLNVAVFKDIENVDFAIMEEPMSKFIFDKSRKKFEIDFEYADQMLDEMRELYKVMKKTKKKNFKEKDKIN